MEPKRPSENLTDIQRVFGADVTYDDEGRPIEHGVGSMPVVGKWEGQRKVFPTSRASTKPSDETWTFLHRMVAAASPEIQRQFQEFLKYLKERERF